MTQLSIGEGTRVTLHFAVKLENGDVVDSNFGGEPAEFTVGDGNLPDGFERKLYGLVAGTTETFTVPPEEGFGANNPNNLQKIPRQQFAADIELEQGLVLSFADAQNTELPGVVAEFNDDFVTIDFNHPLAGRTLLFDVQIIDVVPAATH